MESDIITHVACDTYPIFKHMSSYIDDLKPHLNGHLIILGIQVHLLIPWHELVQ